MTYRFKPVSPGDKTLWEQIVELQQRFAALAGHRHTGEDGEGPVIVGEGGAVAPATSVIPETSFDQSPDVGTSAAYARADHTHGTMGDPFPAHSSDPDAHHAQVHALTGGDHTVSGLTQYHVLMATGASSFGFQPMFDDLLGDPAMLGIEIATSPGVGMTAARRDHVHAISGSYNPGANARLLRSDSAGGLVLEYLGLGGVCDPQFLLDVYGNAKVRGWIVGKHAIQVKDARMICHFDGPEPYATDYTGEANGHLGQVATVAGDVIFRPGKFGKAVQTGPTTTNLLANPSFETDTSGWAAWNETGGDFTATRITSEAYIGSACVRLTKSTATVAQYYGYWSGTAGQPYTISVWLRADAPMTVQLYLQKHGSPYTIFANAECNVTTEWKRFSVSYASAPATEQLRFNLYFNPDDNGTLYVDAAQAETLAYATPYADATLPGHLGATRENAYLTYKNPIVDARRGTVMMWVNPSGYHVNGGVLWQAGATNGALDAYITNSGDVLFRRTSASSVNGGNVPRDTWTHLAFVWGDGAQRIYKNGVQVNTTSQPSTAPAMHANFGVGYSIPIGSAYILPGYIDELAVIGRALDADEIRAIYESDAPIFAETSTWGWRSPSNKVWADADGLWAQDGDGNAVLGLACVDSASWGGTTLGLGDFMLGRAQSGAANLLWDASAKKLLFRGGTTPQVEIGTDGKLYAGGTNVILDSSGVTLRPGTALSNKITWQNNAGLNAAQIYAEHQGLISWLRFRNVPSATYPNASFDVYLLDNSGTSGTFSLSTATNGSVLSITSTDHAFWSIGVNSYNYWQVDGLGSANPLLKVNGPGNVWVKRGLTVGDVSTTPDDNSILASGRVYGTTPTGGRFYYNATQNAGTSWTVLALNATRWNNRITVSSNRLYPQDAGYYIAGIALSTLQSEDQDTKQWMGAIRKNGIDYMGIQDINFATSTTGTLYYHMVLTTGAFYMNGSTDYIEGLHLTNKSDDGGTVTIGAGTAAYWHQSDVWIVRIA